jgi:hypothetical protein
LRSVGLSINELLRPAAARRRWETAAGCRHEAAVVRYDSRSSLLFSYSSYFGRKLAAGHTRGLSSISAVLQPWLISWKFSKTPAVLHIVYVISRHMSSMRESINFIFHSKIFPSSFYFDKPILGIDYRCEDGRF